MRIYDPRLGRFLSVDPLFKSYPYYSPYQFAGNSPIFFIDLDGGEPKDPGKYGGQGGEAPIYTKDNKGNEVASKDLHKWVWNKGTWGLLPWLVHLPSPKTVSSLGPVSSPTTSSFRKLRRKWLICRTYLQALRKTGSLYSFIPTTAGCR